AGVAAPQLYLGLPAPDNDAVQPPKQLKGYAKVTVPPGAKRTVTFPLTQRDLSYWDSAAADWAVAPGCYAVMVGRSSRDIVQHGVLAAGGASCGAGAVPVCPKQRVTIRFR